MRNTFLKTAGVLALLFVGGISVQAQSVSGASAPVYRDTGNPSADQARYESEKQKWYLTNFDLGSKEMSAEQKEAVYAENKAADTRAAELKAQGLTAEQAAHIQNKAALYAADPAAYDAKSRELGLLGNSGVKEIPLSEFNQMSPEKQANIKADPSKYRVVNTTK